MKITCVHQLMSKYIYPKEYFPTIKWEEIYMLIYADVWAPWQSSPKRPDTVNHIVQAVLVSVVVIKCSDWTLGKERVYFGLHSRSQYITEKSRQKPEGKPSCYSTMHLDPRNSLYNWSIQEPRSWHLLAGLQAVTLGWLLSYRVRGHLSKEWCCPWWAGPSYIS